MERELRQGVLQRPESSGIGGGVAATSGRAAKTVLQHAADKDLGGVEVHEGAFRPLPDDADQLIERRPRSGWGAALQRSHSSRRSSQIVKFQIARPLQGETAEGAAKILEDRGRIVPGDPAQPCEKRMAEPGLVEREPFVHLARDAAGREDISQQPPPGLHVPDHDGDVSWAEPRAYEIGHVGGRQFGLVALTGGQQEPDPCLIGPCRRGLLPMPVVHEIPLEVGDGRRGIGKSLRCELDGVGRERFPRGKLALAGEPPGP